MERVRWTDDVLDVKMAALDETSQRLIAAMDALRAEFNALRAEIRSETVAIRSDISALQRQLTRIVFGFAVGLLGIVAAGVGATVAGL